MIWLSSSTLVRLHDQLQARGQRPSLVAPEAGLSPEAAEELNLAAEDNETLNELAEGLGIDEARANELLDDVEKDLSSQVAAKE